MTKHNLIQIICGVWTIGTLAFWMYEKMYQNVKEKKRIVAVKGQLTKVVSSDYGRLGRSLISFRKIFFIFVRKICEEKFLLATCEIFVFPQATS